MSRHPTETNLNRNSESQETSGISFKKLQICFRDALDKEALFIFQKVNLNDLSTDQKQSLRMMQDFLSKLLEDGLAPLEISNGEYDELIKNLSDGNSNSARAWLYHFLHRQFLEILGEREFKRIDAELTPLILNASPNFTEVFKEMRTSPLYASKSRDTDEAIRNSKEREEIKATEDHENALKNIEIKLKKADVPEEKIAQLKLNIISWSTLERGYLGSMLYLLEFQPDLIRAHIDEFVTDKTKRQLIDVLACFNCPSQIDLLVEANITAVLSYESVSQLAFVLKILMKNGHPLSDATTESIVRSGSLPICNAFIALYQAGFSAQDYPNLFERLLTHPDLTHLVTSLITLKNDGVTDKECYNFVANCPKPTPLAIAFSTLQKAGILTPHNRDKIMSNPSFSAYPRLLDLLFNAGILTQNNFDAVVGRQDALTICSVCDALIDELRITVNQDIFQSILNQKNLSSLDEAFSLASHFNISLADNVNSVVTHPKPDALVVGARILSDAGMLIEAGGLNRIAASKIPLNYANALSALKRSGIFTPNNLDIIERAKDDEALLTIIVVLSGKGMLTQEIFNAVVTHQDIGSAWKAINNLDLARILNKENLSTVLNHKNPVLLSEYCETLHFSFVLTQANFNKASEKPDLRASMEAIVGLRLAERRGEGHFAAQYLDAVLSHPDPVLLAKAFEILNKANILTPQNADIIAKNPDGSLLRALTQSDSPNVTQDFFDKMVADNSSARSAGQPSGQRFFQSQDQHAAPGSNASSENSSTSDPKRGGGSQPQ